MYTSLSLYITFFFLQLFRKSSYSYGAGTKEHCFTTNQSLWHIKAKEDRKQMTERYDKKRKKKNRLSVQFHTWREWRERWKKRARRERARTEHVWEEEIEKRSEGERESSVRTREAISLSLFIQCGPDTESELIIRTKWRELHASCSLLRELLHLLPLSQSEIRAPGWLPVQKVSSLLFLTASSAVHFTAKFERRGREEAIEPTWGMRNNSTKDRAFLPFIPPSFLHPSSSPSTRFSSNKPEAAEAQQAPWRTRERRTMVMKTRWWEAKPGRGMNHGRAVASKHTHIAQSYQLD